MMWRDRIADRLKELGIAADSCQMLKLLPLVHTAWADGYMDQAEADKIIAYARVNLNLRAQGDRLLHRWLTRRPSHQYVMRGLLELQRLARAPDEPTVEFTDLQSLVSHCEDLARTSAESMGSIWNVSPEHEQALEEIATALCVDNGITWSELVRELDQQPSALPLMRKPPPPQSQTPEQQPRARQRSLADLVRPSGGGWPEPEGGMA